LHRNGSKIQDYHRKEEIWMDRFKDATDAFVKQASNLGDGDTPLVIALQEVARTLDEGPISASLINQYRLLYQMLYERLTQTGVEVDPLEMLLR
jgi:hypothetical protein